ncbi:hypothetical protein [Amycolatopsis sp. cmx-8-4]|uniref:hypothetical protein n=1 Tax=Amycolatopsis sp. cmx-8-4 TaxID=2790947 RepID=UPI003979340F
MDSPPEEAAGKWVKGSDLRTAEACDYASLISIIDDLSFVVLSATRILKEMEAGELDEDASVVVRGLWSAALVAYKRCFSDGKRAFLSEDDVQSLSLKGDVVEWHRFVVQMRNKHIAHSVNPFEEVRVALFLDDDRNVLGAGPLMMKHVSGDQQTVWQLGALASQILDVIRQRASDQLDALLAAAREMEPEALARLKPLELTVPGAEQAGTART